MMDSSTDARRWQHWGGGGLIAAAILQALGLVGYYLTSVRMPAVALPIAEGFALLSATALLLATFPLALGTTRSNGIVGASVTGRVGLIATGVFVMLARVTMLLFFSAGFPLVGTLAAAVDVFEGVAAVAALVASVVIWRQAIATGIARWSLFASVVTTIVAELLSGYSSTISWTLAGLSIAALAFAGLSYLRNRQ